MKKKDPPMTDQDYTLEYLKRRLGIYEAIVDKLNTARELDVPNLATAIRTHTLILMEAKNQIHELAHDTGEPLRVILAASQLVTAEVELALLMIVSKAREKEIIELWEEVFGED